MLLRFQDALRHSTTHHIMSCHVILHHIISYYIISYHVISCHAILTTFCSPQIMISRTHITYSMTWAQCEKWKAKLNKEGIAAQQIGQKKSSRMIEWPTQSCVTHRVYSGDGRRLSISQVTARWRVKMGPSRPLLSSLFINCFTSLCRTVLYCFSQHCNPVYAAAGCARERHIMSSLRGRYDEDMTEGTGEMRGRVM